MSSNGDGQAITREAETACCPLCRLPLGPPGRYISASDEDGDYFVFVICRPCAHRLARLPMPLQLRQMMIAMGRIADHPERYPFRLMASDIEARILVALLAKMGDKGRALRYLADR